MDKVQVKYIVVTDNYYERDVKIFNTVEEAKRWDRQMQAMHKAVDVDYISKIWYPESS